MSVAARLETVPVIALRTSAMLIKRMHEADPPVRPHRGGQ